MRFAFDPAKSAKNERGRGLPFAAAAHLFDAPRVEWPKSNNKIGEETMAKPGSTRSGKSVSVSSLSRSRAARPSASSLSAKQTRTKPGAIVSVSKRAGKGAKIDWSKIAGTREAAIARHARQDGSRPPSDRAWNKMVEEGRVAIVPPPKVDVRAIREKLNLSQAEFAARFGFTASAVRQWEQGRRFPHGPARILLTIVDREPGAVRRALAPAR